MRKLIFFFLLMVISLSYLFEIDELIVKKFTFFNDLKLSYIDKIVNFSTTAEVHLNQASTIKKLNEENEQLKKYKILSIFLENRLNKIKDLIITLDTQEIKPKIDLVKVVSYINFNDFTEVWLNKEKKNNKILGLITQNYAAGIVINKNNRAVALLNGNKECSYAVFIGENKIPGIITSLENKKNLLIKYIPIWSKVSEGEEVITSGMDNIFFEGLKVGVVTSVISLPDMKMAIVKPYANVLKKRYFFTYEQIEEKQKNIKKINKLP